MYATVVFNIQRTSGFHQYIGILDGAAIHLQCSAFEHINPVSVTHLQGLARWDFERAGAYDDVVGVRTPSPFGGCGEHFRVFIMWDVFPRESRVETGTAPFYGCRFTVRFPSIDIAAFVGRNDFVFSVTIHVRHANAIVHLVRSG